MGKKINIYQIDAFTDVSFEGNPAGVTFGDGLTKDEMQHIAKEMNLAETAFLSASDKADYNLRWFTPKMEVDLCGHATIASLHFLSEQQAIKENTEIRFDTRSGILKCRAGNKQYFMQIPVYKINEYKNDRDPILKAVGLHKCDVFDAIPFLILENGYLYIYVKKLQTIGKLKPNFKDLLKLSKQNSFGGVVVFTQETIEEGNNAHLRFFAPYYGIDEDPVTGSANGPLLFVLNYLGLLKLGTGETAVTFEQGDFIDRRGRIGVRFSSEENELFITGKAVTVMKGEMFF